MKFILMMHCTIKQHLVCMSLKQISQRNTPFIDVCLFLGLQRSWQGSTDFSYTQQKLKSPNSNQDVLLHHNYILTVSMISFSYFTSSCRYTNTKTTVKTVLLLFIVMSPTTVNLVPSNIRFLFVSIISVSTQNIINASFYFIFFCHKNELVQHWVFYSAVVLIIRMKKASCQICFRTRRCLESETKRNLLGRES